MENIIYIIKATNSVTGKFIGYYSKGDIFIKTRPQIKYAKKFSEKDGSDIKKTLNKCKRQCKYCGLAANKINWEIIEIK